MGKACFQVDIAPVSSWSWGSHHCCAEQHQCSLPIAPQAPGSHSSSAYAEDALNPWSFPLPLFPGHERSVQPQCKPSRTRIPLPPSPPLQVAQKSLPAGDVGMGQLLPHPIELLFHHLERWEGTTRAAPLGCTHSAPFGNAWHQTLVAPQLPRAVLPLLFPEDLSFPCSPCFCLSGWHPPSSLPGGALPAFSSPPLDSLLWLPLFF